MGGNYQEGKYEGSVHGACTERARSVHKACTDRARSVHGVCTERARSVQGAACPPAGSGGGVGGYRDGGLEEGRDGRSVFYVLI